jgi:hypothetical protein
MSNQAITVADVKRQFPLPVFMSSRGFGEHVHKSARCPFHDDRKNSFSVFQGSDGDWRWNCFAGCGQGDAIDFICKLDKVGFKEGLRKYRHESRRRRVATNNGEAGVAQDSPPANCVHEITFDWLTCVQQLGSEADAVAELAKRRGYNIFTLWLLLGKQLIGRYDGHFAFPVRDECGQTVVGCHYAFPEKKAWYYTRGCSSTPLLIGIGLKHHATESTWDAIALVDRFGYENITVICTRGASNGRRIVAHVPPDQPVRLWPQNDKAGEDWCRTAQNTLSKAIICPTPKQFKDCNEWFASL